MIINHELINHGEELLAVSCINTFYKLTQEKIEREIIFSMMKNQSH